MQEAETVDMVLDRKYMKEHPIWPPIASMQLPEGFVTRHPYRVDISEEYHVRFAGFECASGTAFAHRKPVWFDGKQIPFSEVVTEWNKRRAM